MPVEVLKELEVYERLIVDVAKAVFLQRNPNRQRVPKGFEQRLHLTIRHVDPGSAIPVLLRSIDHLPGGQASLLPPADDEFDEARDLLEKAVQAAASGKPLPTEFPSVVLSRFNTFGRSLRPDESIELRRSRDAKGPRYDRALRKKLVLMTAKSFTDSVDVTGEVVEADVERHVFHLAFQDRRVASVLPAEHEDAVLVAFRGHTHLRLRVIGTGRYDAQERLERIEEVDDALVFEEEPVTVERFRSRISELKDLPDGWLDGAGTQLSKTALDAVADAFVHLHDQEDVPLPYLYPSPDGHIGAEWTMGSWEISADIDPDTLETVLDAVDAETAAGREERAAIATPDGRNALARFVTAFGRKGAS